MSNPNIPGHWEALFDKNYFRWFHLNGKPALVEIVSIERKLLTLPSGAKKKKPVLTIKQIKGGIQDIKPLVGNTTNLAEIAKIHGDDPVGWFGKQIVLFQDKTQLGKDIVPCIRIRAPKPAAAKPKSDPKPETKEPESTPRDPDIPF